MKKIILFALVVFVMTACSNNQDKAKQEQQEREALEKIVEKYNEDDSDISAEYDEDKRCINLSWKCETFTANYYLHFNDLLTEKPTSYADGFCISMVLFIRGVTKIDMLEFNYEGIKYKVFPFFAKTIDDRGITMAGFSTLEESTKECLKMLSNLDGLVTGKIYTNKGPIDMPLNDVLNLRSMAHSYIMDGGKFE